jgi:hypothetical protein
MRIVSASFQFECSNGVSGEELTSQQQGRIPPGSEFRGQHDESKLFVYRRDTYRAGSHRRGTRNTCVSACWFCRSVVSSQASRSRSSRGVLRVKDQGHNSPLSLGQIVSVKREFFATQLRPVTSANYKLSGHPVREKNCFTRLQNRQGTTRNGA